LQQLNTTPEQPKSDRKISSRNIVFVLLSLVLFLFAIDLLVASLQSLGADVVQMVIEATSNPFTALFIGLLITALIQSSSTTTSVVVALVASGSLSISAAIPIIMGANVGTTITSTIVSLGFINKKKEFRRAVTAGTYHCFFNLLTVVILFPLEYYYQFLSGLSEYIAGYFFSQGNAEGASTGGGHWSLFGPVSSWLVGAINNAFILVVMSLVMLFGSILFFRKFISDLLEASSPENFSRFFFKNHLKSFGWGLLTTAAIRSSTITTSVVVPIVAKKIASIRQAAPFIMGANVGTTITAFIAAILNTNSQSAISIAMAHFLFNLIGVILFFPIPALQEIPLKLSERLGRLTLRFRLAGFVFILLTFFFIPFSLIYFNQDSIRTSTITYAFEDGSGKKTYTMKTRTNTRNGNGEWVVYEGSNTTSPAFIFPISTKNNSLFVGNELYLFTKPGFCWDGEDQSGHYEACIENIRTNLKINGTVFDSVYVCLFRYAQPLSDTSAQRIFLSRERQLILKREVLNPGDSVIASFEIMAIQDN